MAARPDKTRPSASLPTHASHRKRSSAFSDLRVLFPLSCCSNERMAQERCRRKRIPTLRELLQYGACRLSFCLPSRASFSGILILSITTLLPLRLALGAE